MKKTRIAFIQKSWEDNIGILSIVAVLKQSGFEAHVLVEEKGTYEEVKDFAPDVVGYSCYTGDQTWVFDSINKSREAGITAKVLIGGPHATFFPELIESPLVDIICRGEGEYPTLEYAEALERGEDGHAIQNLCFRTNTGIVHNPLRPLITNLDALPFPDRSYYDRYRFLATNPFKIFITGRGCPYRCTFCFNHSLHALYGKSSHFIRRRSVENVIAELREVQQRWGIDEIRFSDDHFALSAEWLLDFSTHYLKEIDRPFTVNARVDVLDDQRVACLKKSGCRLVCFGIESGRQDFRNDILKKNISDEQIYQASALLKKYGIKFLTSNIIGLPEETPEDSWKTIAINRRIGADLPWFSMMQYYPGTEIFEHARELGMIDESFSVDDITTYFENKYLHHPNMNELQNIHSFSIVACKFGWFEPLLRILSRQLRPNPVFRTLFKISYLLLTAKRGNFGFFRQLKMLRFHFDKIFSFK